MTTPKELYPSLVQMIIHAENISWNRLYNFLMFNTILVLAWTTLYAGSCQLPKSYVPDAICVFGCFSGIVWAALGYRGRKFLDAYLKMAKKLESVPEGEEIGNESCRMMTGTFELSKSIGYNWASSTVLLSGVPAAFTILYVVMYFVPPR